MPTGESMGRAPVHVPSKLEGEQTASSIRERGTLPSSAVEIRIRLPFKMEGGKMLKRRVGKALRRWRIL